MSVSEIYGFNPRFHAAISPRGDICWIAILIYRLVSFPKNIPLTRTYIKCSFSLEGPRLRSPSRLTYDE